MLRIARGLPLVLLLAAAVYSIALTGPFQFDDYAGVAVERGANALDAWWQRAALHVRPLTKLSFVASAALGEAIGHLPGGHRAVNLAIHLLAVSLFVWLGRVLADTCLPDIGRRASDACALTGGLVLGVHPLATEAVSYISARSMTLGTLLAVASLLAWIGWRRTDRMGSLVAAWCCVVGAVLARETAIVAPLLWLAWEAARADRRAPSAHACHGLAHAAIPADGPSRAVRRAGAWAIAVLATGGLAAWLLWHPRYVALTGVSAALALANAGNASFIPALGYFAEVFALVRYPSIDPAFDPSAITPALRVLWCGLLALGAVLAWRVRRQRPELLIAACWILAWIGPLYAVRIRYDAIAERHAYPLIWPFAWAVAVSVARWAGGRRGRQRVATMAAGLACAAMLSVSMARNADYRSEVTLWEAAWRGAPDRVRVLNNLAVAYMDSGRWDEALRLLEHAVSIDPLDERAQDNLLIAQRREFGGVRWPRTAP